jgi:uncharacterized damage-inducible protein DinB
MINTIKEFETLWTEEIDRTQKVLDQLTDQSLAQAIEPGGRTLGRLAWHITLTVPEMMSRTGLAFSIKGDETPVPASAEGIRGTYSRLAKELLSQVKTRWTDQTLEIIDEMYGQRWTRGLTLTVLVFHQVHHRGQMTVLMRQAGLKVPGLFGPAREEWNAWGVPLPLI